MPRPTRRPHRSTDRTDTFTLRMTLKFDEIPNRPTLDRLWERIDDAVVLATAEITQVAFRPIASRTAIPRRTLAAWR